MSEKVKKEIFPAIGKIRYEGRDSRNPLAFRWYDPEAKVGGKKMKEVLRYAVAYWHSFCGDGTDTFGAATRHFPYEGMTGDDRIRVKMDMAFEFISKIGAP
ncbi:MAG: xylose isomerase, partial [Bacteroidales bacterium]|nr:xylose isomerase [Bacteroidales bacterium]